MLLRQINPVARPARYVASFGRTALGTIWAAAMLLGGSLTACAQEASPPIWRIDHFKHTGFSEDQGAPTDVSSMAQTRDGYLWVGSAGQGLVRFDGLRFVPFSPAHGEHLLSPQVAALFAAADGGLWMGYEFQGASLLKGGHLTHYTVSDGYTVTITSNIFEGYRGRIYAIGNDRFIAMSQGRWSPVVRDEPQRRVHAAVVDGKGGIWLAGEDRLYWCSEDDCHIEDVHVETPHRIISMAISPEHVLYASEALGVIRRFRIEGVHLTELAAVPVFSVSPSFDRHGGVWLPSLGHGVLRLAGQAITHDDIQKSPPADTYGKADGLTGDYVWPSLVDSEGDIWVGTQYGVDRFRQVSLVKVVAPSGLQSPKVVPGARSEAWVGSGLPLMRWDGSTLKPTTVGAYAFGMCTDATTGKSWLAYSDGLWELTDLGPKHVAPAPSSLKVTATQMACGNNGQIFAFYQLPVGSFEWSDGRWKRRPELDIPSMIVAAPDGRFFVGRKPGRLVVINGAERREYGRADGLNIGNPKAMATFQGALVLGGDEGLAFFKDDHFHALVLAGPRPLKDVTGLAFDDSGALWVHMPDGVAQIAGRDITAAVSDPSHKLSFRWLSSIDGMPGVPAQDVPMPSLSQGGDGRLWFTSQSGIAWLDPRDLVTNTVPPRPRIEALVVDGVRYPVEQTVKVLPPRPRSVEIDFNAPLLRAAESGRFLYRLEGVDRDWQEAGSRREAFYSNLGPGDHRFHLRVANENGVWNDADSSLTFHIQPAFYETWWFRVFCGLMLVGAACIGYVLHIRQVTARLRIREDERMRIARDLHDTLLQSVQAMLVRVETIKDRTSDLWARTEAERVADWGRQAVSDGRTKVARLRSDDDEAYSPIAEVLEIVRDLSESAGIVLHTHLTGGEPSLNSLAAHEVANVIREISNNALRHSGGKNLWISINHGNRDFVVSIKDDGHGIDESIRASGEKSGHWGLKGARERICSLGGTLSIQTTGSLGTEITVRVPTRRLHQRA
ncbi:sensor histidine kinase [Dyella telluris]|uniref:sensor histidine kinase n=1 Tax=Dyella telluris TaxID=2763498 RepID=UPI001EE6321D|nr:sensor histidine kinase [Dyella telluris]